MEPTSQFCIFLLILATVSGQRQLRRQDQQFQQRPETQPELQQQQPEVQVDQQHFEDVRTPFDTTTKRARFLYEFNSEFDPPVLTFLPPNVNFTCSGKAPGYYADPDQKCQVYHLCMPDGRKYTMLCGVGTVFNQRTFVCDHWYNYPCANAQQDYRLNNELWDQVLLPHSGHSPSSLNQPSRNSLNRNQQDRKPDYDYQN